MTRLDSSDTPAIMLRSRKLVGATTTSPGDPSCYRFSEDTSERRRVNPENLALRLAPDLVRDMEALILPGNVEMPSFAVRLELQKRYNVDRRHIYDYFHSRGLRVLRESKSDVALSSILSANSHWVCSVL